MVGRKTTIHVQKPKLLGFPYQAENIVYKYTDRGIKTLSVDMFTNCFTLFCEQLSIYKQINLQMINVLMHMSYFAERVKCWPLSSTVSFKHKPFINISINPSFYLEVAYKYGLSNTVNQFLTISCT